ncbi:hypothetical protein ELS83_02535 [Marinifilum sp. JC070]|uniref:DUF885 domain-containing protein n=2 Tax=Marinifilum caeruleilacunae TaxID=2499076 RepID=A0ABX1WRG8_9BACT|nr:hypothetical protein [Marinifilum caeruleilacunae]
MNHVAERYVKTVLEIGLYDPLYVDAYYGPEDWKNEVEKLKKEQIPADELIARLDELSAKVKELDLSKEDEMLQLRKQYLLKQFIAVRARVEMLSGKNFTFNEESKHLYDAVVPDFEDEHFAGIINELERLVPGKGSLIDRLSVFQKDFVIPKDKVDAVFRAAIEESRKRTKQHIPLPENENFELEYVTDKAWAGYNWYKGNNFSLIQVNIDFPILIDRAIDLASHEGYPGHHVYNSLLESNLVKERGWNEFSVYPLFSPQSLIAEGTANYGIHVVFPREERMKFEKEVLFPLAGLDTDKVDLYYKIQELTHELTYARTTAMRNYLDGKWSKEETGKWMEKYALRRASESTFRFPETYRSYIINYNWGQDMVKEYVEKRGGVESNPDKRWEIFTHLISTPQVPENLR